MTGKTGPWDKFGAMLTRVAQQTESTLERATAKAAAKMVSGIKKNIVGGGEPAGMPFAPIKPATIAAKGSSKPLIDSGDMLRSVSSIKQGEMKYLVTIPEGPATGSGDSIAEYARKHEFGEIDERGRMLIARPFFFPMVRKMERGLKDDIKKALEDLFK